MRVLFTNAFQFAGSIMTLITVLAAKTFIQMPNWLRRWMFNESDVANKKKAINTMYFLFSLFYLSIGFCIPTISHSGDFWIFSLKNKGLTTLLLFCLLVSLLVLIAVCLSKFKVSKKYK